jgi:hypothetical protein
MHASWAGALWAAQRDARVLAFHHYFEFAARKWRRTAHVRLNRYGQNASRTAAASAPSKCRTPSNAGQFLNPVPPRNLRSARPSLMIRNPSPPLIRGMARHPPTLPMRNRRRRLSIPLRLQNTARTRRCEPIPAAAKTDFGTDRFVPQRTLKLRFRCFTNAHRRRRLLRLQ